MNSVEAHRVLVKYRNSKGEETERTIRVTHISDQHIAGRCEYRKDRRTFRRDRILSAVDLETGEVFV